MDPVREAIRARLTGDETLVGMLPLPDAVYHRRAVRQAPMPHVVFDRQAGTETGTFNAGERSSQVWLVKAVDRGYPADRAEDIDRELARLLDLADLIVDGKPVQQIRRETLVAYGEDVGGDIVHHVGATYRIDVQPAT